jgi:hypothetical protein
MSDRRRFSSHTRASALHRAQGHADDSSDFSHLETAEETQLDDVR